MFIHVVDTTEMNFLPHIEKRKSEDVLIIVDDVAWKLEMGNTDIRILRETQGFDELAELITDGYLDVSDYKVIVLMVGRQELWKTDDMFEMAFRSCLMTIEDRNPDGIILLTPTLLRPGDCEDTITKVRQRSVMLAYYAHDTIKVEFCRPALKLEDDNGAIDSYYDLIKDLNDQGVMELKKQLMEKIYAGGLLEMWCEIINRL